MLDEIESKTGHKNEKDDRKRKKKYIRRINSIKKVYKESRVF